MSHFLYVEPVRNLAPCNATEANSGESRRCQPSRCIVATVNQCQNEQKVMLILAEMYGMWSRKADAFSLLFYLLVKQLLFRDANAQVLDTEQCWVSMAIRPKAVPSFTLLQSTGHQLDLAFRPEHFVHRGRGVWFCMLSYPDCLQKCSV